jgi:hypothetical protein
MDWGKTVHLLVGSLARSCKWRAVLSASQDQPHLVSGLDTVSRGLGGVSRVWRFDRMATVCDPGSGRVTASFAGVAKHYGVSVATCPPRRGNRKGVVEKINHTAAQRWWRTLADDVSVEQAQVSVDHFAAVRGDTRLRATATGRSSVATVAAAEPLQSMPATPYPVIVSEPRTASRQALVACRGNRYSVPPELAAAQVIVSHPLGEHFLDIATADMLFKKKETAAHPEPTASRQPPAASRQPPAASNRSLSLFTHRSNHRTIYGFRLSRPYPENSAKTAPRVSV